MSLDHKIIWNELRVSDVDAALEFYGPLFGWSLKDEERKTYVHLYKGDTTVAGFQGPHGSQSEAPHWHVYVGTSDIESYVKRAEDAGGKAPMGIMDIPYTGKVSHVSDPAGAVLTPFQVADPKRTSWGHSSKSGHFCWVELLSQDAQRAADFYSKVVGWQLLDVDLGDTQYKLLIPPGGGQESAQGGLMQMDNPDVIESWLPYVGVDSVEETAALATQLGGQICVQPGELGGHGKFAVLIDPQGAVLGIYESLGST